MKLSMPLAAQGRVRDAIDRLEIVSRTGHSDDPWCGWCRMDVPAHTTDCVIVLLRDSLLEGHDGNHEWKESRDEPHRLGDEGC